MVTCTQLVIFPGYGEIRRCAQVALLDAVVLCVWTSSMPAASWEQVGVSKFRGLSV